MYLIYFFCISTLFNLFLFSEYLKQPDPKNSGNFLSVSVTEVTHKLAVEGNFIGLTIQHFKEQFSGALGGAIAVATLTTWQYRNKQKDLEAITRHHSKQ